MPEGNPPDSGAPAPEQLKSFNQSDVDKIVQDRLARERAKFGDYDDLKAKATKFDELEAANKSELEKANERAAQAEQRAKAAEDAARSASVRNAVIAAAAKAGAVDTEAVLALADLNAVTVDNAGKVTGADKAVEALLAEKAYLRGGSSASQRKPDQGPRGASTPPVDLNEQFRSMLRKD